MAIRLMQKFCRILILNFNLFNTGIFLMPDNYADCVKLSIKILQILRLLKSGIRLMQNNRTFVLT